MENWLYFRTATSVANDNGIAGTANSFTSICIPASRIVSINPSADNFLFISIKNTRIDEHSGGTFTDTENHDYIKIECTAGKVEEIQKAIFEAIAGNGKSGFIVVGDDAIGEYLHPDITSIGDIQSYEAPPGEGYHTIISLQKIHNAGNDQAVASLPFTLSTGSVIIDANMKILNSNSLIDNETDASVNLKYHTAAVADGASTAGTELLGTESISTCIPDSNLNIGSGDTSTQIINFGTSAPIALGATTHFHLNATEDLSSGDADTAFVVTTIKWFGNAATLIDVS
tara:strand:+ start:1607 stop:2464 length:858 start_codon:yes stop_codon:yes gene_type:complete